MRDKRSFNPSPSHRCCRFSVPPVDTGMGKSGLPENDSHDGASSLTSLYPSTWECPLLQWERFQQIPNSGSSNPSGICLFNFCNCLTTLADVISVLGELYTLQGFMIHLL